MTGILSAKALDFLQKPYLAHLVTLMRDGSPHVTPVWVDTDGEHVLVNTAEGRLKVRNVRRNPHVALSLVDPSDAWATLQVRGSVIEVTSSGADAHIDKLAKKYMGKDKYPWRRSGEVRVILKIRAERVSGTVARG